MHYSTEQIQYILKNIEEFKHFNIIHIYDTPTKNWVFHKYNCNLCDSSFKTPQAVKTHIKRCKYINGKIKRNGPGKPSIDIEPIYIFDINGNEWKPFNSIAENYQNYADK